MCSMSEPVAGSSHEYIAGLSFAWVSLVLKESMWLPKNFVFNFKSKEKNAHVEAESP